MPDFERTRIAREDIPPPVGRRMVVRCERIGCGHAAIIDPRTLFSPTGWPREGWSNRFRCFCGCRYNQVTYTSNIALRERAIGKVALALWV